MKTKLTDKEAFQINQDMLFGKGKPFNHVHPTMGLIYCDECHNYGGKVQNITEETTLDELFCEKGLDEVETYLKENGVKL